MPCFHPSPLSLRFAWVALTQRTMILHIQSIRKRIITLISLMIYAFLWRFFRYKTGCEINCKHSLHLLNTRKYECSRLTYTCLFRYTLDDRIDGLYGHIDCHDILTSYMFFRRITYLHNSLTNTYTQESESVNLQTGFLRTFLFLSD